MISENSKRRKKTSSELHQRSVQVSTVYLNILENNKKKRPID
jgi:hypothetical protein